MLYLLTPTHYSVLCAEYVHFTLAFGLCVFVNDTLIVCSVDVH